MLLGNAFGVRGQAWESDVCLKWINKIEVCIEKDFGGHPEALTICQESLQMELEGVRVLSREEKIVFLSSLTQTETWHFL